jgi:AhpD family alkylhydroperoxidase
MAKLEVFDPAMCCDTGVCGAEVDPLLPRFAGDLEWIKSNGVTVRRFNLAQEPGAFVANPAVKKILDETGGDGLPVITLNGAVVSQGSYPTRAALARLAGIDEESGPASGPLVTPAVAELIAIGASIAANCEACLKYHYNEARSLGVSKQDMLRAVNIALQVKNAPAQALIHVANKLLSEEGPADNGCAPNSGCCD